MASQGMMLRNMALVGSTQNVPMPPQHKPLFEEGVALIFERWTALQLAVHNEWGGANSKEKAGSLHKEVLEWFYSSKDPEPSDLEEYLDEALHVDFNVQAEDDSPYQVARSLVNMHNQVARGDVSYIESLRALQPASAEACQNANGNNDENDDDDNDHSSSDDDNDDDNSDHAEAMDTDDQPPEHKGPIVDDDGFELVQRKGRR